MATRLRRAGIEQFILESFLIEASCGARARPLELNRRKVGNVLPERQKTVVMLDRAVPRVELSRLK